MNALRFFHARRSSGWALFSVLAALVLAGCQTPDLKPFASASATLATSIKQGGDLAVGRNAALQAEWETRRKTADALLVYSASLAAIADASAKRKENATELVAAVRKLAAVVPGATLGTNAAGNLAINLIGGFTEVKAFHDLAAAVESADRAIAPIAEALTKDFAALSSLYADRQRNHANHLLAALAGPERYCDALKAEQTRLRSTVAKDVANRETGAELTRIDGLLAGVETEVTAKRAELAQTDADLATGRTFFTTAANAIDAWATAHAEIAKALRERRTPNLSLLAARAQEIRGLIEDLKPTKPTEATKSDNPTPATP